MKSIIIYILIAVLVVGCFAGCNSTGTVTSSGETSSLDAVSDEQSSVVNEDSSSDGEPVATAEYTSINGHTLRRGVNINSLEGKTWGNDRYLYDEFTFQNISEKGFDHVRLPVDFRLFADEEGNLIDSKMKVIDKIIETSHKYNLVVFLDFHGWYYLNTYKGDGELFKTLWKNVTIRYKDYEKNDMLIFELINEPHATEGSNLDLKNLEILQCETADIIREISPERTICFTTTDSSKPETLVPLENGYDFRDTKMMEYDNIIIAIHIYHPDAWTGQGLDWWKHVNRYEDYDFIPVYLDNFLLAETKTALKNMADFKKETGIPVIMNEFGWNTLGCREEDQVKFMQTMMDCLNENGIPCTWWAYNNGEMALYRKKNMFSKAEWNDLLVDMMLK